MRVESQPKAESRDESRGLRVRFAAALLAARFSRDRQQLVSRCPICWIVHAVLFGALVAEVNFRNEIPLSRFIAALILAEMDFRFPFFAKAAEHT